MAIICWGNLAKSADSTERIEEAIQDYIENHDSDPNAHMGADYSLGGHRLQTELDHPPNSVQYFHINDIHAEKITAGGMVVKGNGPYIVVQDNGGYERVKIYPEGIIIKNGRIIIENEFGTNIIDDKGLIGENIFLTGQKTTITDQALPSNGSFAACSYMEFGVYVPRSTPCMIFPNMSFKGLGDNGSRVLMRVWHDTEYIPNSNGWWWQKENIYSEYSGFFNITRIINLFTGFNKVQVQMRRYNTWGLFNIAFVSTSANESGIGYMLMGS